MRKTLTVLWTTKATEMVWRARKEGEKKHVSRNVCGTHERKASSKTTEHTHITHTHIDIHTKIWHFPIYFYLDSLGWEQKIKQHTNELTISPANVSVCVCCAYDGILRVIRFLFSRPPTSFNFAIFFFNFISRAAEQKKKKRNSEMGKWTHVRLIYWKTFLIADKKKTLLCKSHQKQAKIK